MSMGIHDIDMVQVERVTQEMPFTRADCCAFPDAEEVQQCERAGEAALECAPGDLPLMSAMAATNAAASAAAIASAQVSLRSIHVSSFHVMVLEAALGDVPVMSAMAVAYAAASAAAASAMAMASVQVGMHFAHLTTLWIVYTKRRLASVPLGARRELQRPEQCL